MKFIHCPVCVNERRHQGQYEIAVTDTAGLSLSCAEHGITFFNFDNDRVAEALLEIAGQKCDECGDPGCVGSIH